MVTALRIGAMQMYRMHGGFWTDYGADVFGTAWLYGTFRQGRSVIQKRRPLSPEGAATVVLFGCIASEFCQLGRVLPGVFDVYDLAAYAGAVAGCYGLDRWLTPLAGDLPGD